MDYNCVGEIAILGYYDTDTIRPSNTNVIHGNDISLTQEQMGAFYCGCVAGILQLRLYEPVFYGRCYRDRSEATWKSI